MRTLGDMAVARKSAAESTAVWGLGGRVAALACCVIVAGCASVERPSDAVPQGGANDAKAPAVQQRRGVPAKTPLPIRRVPRPGPSKSTKQKEHSPQCQNPRTRHRALRPTR